VHGIVVCR